MVMFD